MSKYYSILPEVSGRVDLKCAFWDYILPNYPNNINFEKRSEKTYLFLYGYSSNRSLKKSCSVLMLTGVVTGQSCRPKHKYDNSHIKYTTSRSTDFVHDWALVAKPLNYDTEYLFVQVLCRVYNLSPVCWITSCIQQNISLSYKKYALFTRENKEDFS